MRVFYLIYLLIINNNNKNNNNIERMLPHGFVEDDGENDQDIADQSNQHHQHNTQHFQTENAISLKYAPHIVSIIHL